jgi:hypothetical protein
MTERIPAQFSERDRLVFMQAKESLRIFCKMGNQPWWGGTMSLGHVFLTGGAIASILQGEQPKDLDFYFYSQGAMNEWREHLLKNDQYIADVKENYKLSLGQDGKMITANAITMKSGHSFITRFCGDREFVKKSFDYAHCCADYDPWTEKLRISPLQYWCIKNKVLMVNNQDNVTQWREDKFINRWYVKYDTLQSLPKVA